MKALPTLLEPLACHARSNACRSWRRRSSKRKVSCRRLAAAPAPAPSCDSRSRRQWALALTTVTLIALLTSPITLPSIPSPASHPCALLMAATRDSAKASRSLWKWGLRSPQGPATTDFKSQLTHLSFYFCNVALGEIMKVHLVLLISKDIIWNKISKRRRKK